MIPACAIKVCLKSVCEGASRGYRALLHRRTASCQTFGAALGDLARNLHAIVPRRLFLQNSVPMQCSTLFWTGDFVMDCDHESVSPVGLQCRRRKLPVDQKNTRVHSIWCYETPRDCKVVSPNDTRVRWVGVGVGVACSIGAPRISIREWLTDRSVESSVKLETC